jgi:hypothetical protein
MPCLALSRCSDCIDSVQVAPSVYTRNLQYDHSMHAVLDSSLDGMPRSAGLREEEARSPLDRCTPISVRRSPTGCLVGHGCLGAPMHNNVCQCVPYGLTSHRGHHF